MKSFLSLTLTMLAVFTLATGCVRRYKVTLTNHTVFTTHGKPKVDEKAGTVKFTDAEGKKHVMPLFNVRTIEPR